MRRLYLFLSVLFLWIPAVAAQDDTVPYTTHIVQRGETLSAIATRYNVCPDAILDFNAPFIPTGYATPNLYDGLKLYLAENTRINIPTSEPCFEAFTLDEGTRLLDFLRDHNVCINDYLPYNDDWPIDMPVSGAEGRMIHLRLDVPPCYENGQRRVFFLDGEPLPEPLTVPAQQYSAEEDAFLWDMAWENNWCWIDINAVNHPQAYYNGLHAGDVYYVPDDVRPCDVIFPDGETLIDLSFEHNICIEALMEYNPYLVTTWVYITQNDNVEYAGYRIFKREVSLPQEYEPCYDDNGTRIGTNDKAVHRTQPHEWLHLIAQEYDVCVSDLENANPSLAESRVNLYTYRLPALLYIPDAASCAESTGSTLVHTVQQDETLHDILYQYNVCPHQLATANPAQIQDSDGRYSFTVSDYNTDQQYNFKLLEAGDELVIPQDRPPCYTMNNPNYPQQIRYICYTEEIDFDADYSNHEPVISPVAYDSDEATHCYDFDEQSHIILNNETVWFYSAMIVDAAMMVECFGIHPEAIRYTIWDIPTDYIPSGWYWTITNPATTCPLATGTPDEAQAWRAAFRQQVYEYAGHINEDGVYTVAPYDTLTNIGQRYGYLPSMLAAANDLDNPDRLLLYQPLQMPKYPNLYALAKIGGGLLLILIFMGVIQFGIRRRSGGKKKKRSE